MWTYLYVADIFFETVVWDYPNELARVRNACIQEWYCEHQSDLFDSAPLQHTLAVTLGYIVADTATMLFAPSSEDSGAEWSILVHHVVVSLCSVGTLAHCGAVFPAVMLINEVGHLSRISRVASVETDVAPNHPMQASTPFVHIHQLLLNRGIKSGPLVTINGMLLW